MAGDEEGKNEVERAWLEGFQVEQKAWSIRNFGDGPQHRPVVGMIEELGELFEALEERNVLASTDDDERCRAAIEDAVGDVIVYMVNVCWQRGWLLADLWETRFGVPDIAFKKDGSTLQSPVTHMRWLAHHQLKGEQHIRGGYEEHNNKMQDRCRAILFLLDRVTAGRAMDVAAETWGRVRRRDWTKNPNDAHAVAEQGG